jgi:hypothetical protein
MNATIMNGDMFMWEAAVVKNVAKHSASSFSNAGGASCRLVSAARIIGCKDKDYLRMIRIMD